MIENWEWKLILERKSKKDNGVCRKDEENIERSRSNAEKGLERNEATDRQEEKGS